jgi:hypothetical protein
MRVRDKTNKKQEKQRKMNQFRLLTLKQDFLKVSVSLQTAFAVETHLAEGQWLEEQVNMLKLPMFRVGIRRTLLVDVDSSWPKYIFIETFEEKQTQKAVPWTPSFLKETRA